MIIGFKLQITTNRRKSRPATTVAAVSSHISLTLVLERPVKTAVKSKITTRENVNQLDKIVQAGVCVGILICEALWLLHDSLFL